MAYLHCHSCDWSQDDFYTKRYNPLTKIWDDIKWLWKPKIISLQQDIVDDLVGYTHVPVLRWQDSDWSGYRFFSWNWLLLELVKDIRVAYRTKWWTWKSWKKARDTAVCPKCGDRNFDID